MIEMHRYNRSFNSRKAWKKKNLVYRWRYSWINSGAYDCGDK